MSVYPEFLQHIQQQGLYVDGYNYEEMYNIMIHNLTYNIIPTTNFIYTYQQINELYECLEELLMPIDSDLDETNQIHPETNVNPQMNLQMNNPIDDSDLDDIYESDDEIQVINQPQNQNETPAQIILNNYIQMLNNAANNTANMTHNNINNINNLHNMNNIYYTNLTYYNNINTHNSHNGNNSHNVITYNNNT